MPLPLLTTKLYLPVTRSTLVARPHLRALLDIGLRRKLTLISAPPGFGKTTAVADWIADVRARQGALDIASPTLIACSPENLSPADLSGGQKLAGLGKLKFCWVSLDENDNDPIRFFSYFVAALQRIEPAIGVTLQRLFQAPQPPALEVLLTAVINDIQTIDASLVLVLDDYHLITAPSIHDALTFFVEHLPSSLHLFITSRADPPLPLARWRARRDLVEVRVRDLRFTQEEVRLFLQQELGGKLSTMEIAALEQRTEGWIAGLQLAMLSLTERENVTEFVHTFTGSHAYLADYLMEEVLQCQTQTIQDFLLQTAILERLNAALCESVTQRQGAQLVLEQLERANLFLIPLDNERRWYRYHHLFAEVLRNRLAHQFPLLVGELHHRASGWYEAAGLLTEAVDHGQQSGDAARVATLVEQLAEALLNRGEIVTLQRWLDGLPKAEIERRPLLCLAQAKLCMITHQLEAAERALGQAEVASHKAPQALVRPVNDISSEITAIRVNIALNRSELTTAIRLGEQALAGIPLEKARLRGEVMAHVGLAYLWSSQHEAAGRMLAEAAKLSAAAGDGYTAVLAMSNQANVFFVQGQLLDTVAMLQHALHFAADQGIGNMPITGTLHHTLAEVYYEQNELALAAHHATEALARATQSRNPRLLLLSHVILAQVKAAQQDMTAAQALLDEAQTLVSTYQLAPRYVDELQAARVKQWLRAGDVTAAATWARIRGLTLESSSAVIPMDLGNREEYRLLARVLAAQQQFSAVLPLLDPLRQVNEASHNLLSLLETLAFSCALLYAAGEKVQALAMVERALSLAAPRGFVRTFVNEGEPMKALLVELQLVLAKQPQALQQATLQTYITKLLAAFGAVPNPEQPAAPAAQQPNPKPLPQNLIEPLSVRELELLPLLNQGLSDRQIAETLIIAIGTVKRHLNNIYGKLGVRSRTQALARARELGLL